MDTSFRYLIVLAITVALQACGGGGGGGGDGGGGSSSPPSTTQSEAARFLTQATFGPKQADIDHFVALNDYEAWLNEQFDETRTPWTSQLDAVRARHVEIRTKENDGTDPEDRVSNLTRLRHQAWFEEVLNGPAQLRHRVAYALSQIIVVSDQHPNLSYAQFGMSEYYDILMEHAFGNYRDLLERISLHPVMGVYLSSSGNKKATLTTRPDENYARELLQLFTVGVFDLNSDGTLTDPDNPVPTYTQDDIENLARVFTGWSIDWSAHNYMITPMRYANSNHDQDEKLLLGTSIGVPTLNGDGLPSDFFDALDIIFNHPNVAPFISKQLIQRLVTSNPSPAYVGRVSAVFNDNGSGVKGDLKAVVTAILLDSEARNIGGNGYGKLREPLLRLTHLWRAFDATQLPGGEYAHSWDARYDANVLAYRIPSGFGQNSFFYGDGLEGAMGQSMLRAASVFNFYLPDYIPQGLDIVAPEFQIATENNSVNLLNILNLQIQASHVDPYENYWTTLDLSGEADIAQTSLDDLLDHLNLLLLSGQMSTELRTALSDHVTAAGYDTSDAEHRLALAKDMLTLIISSPEYLIQI